MRDKGHDRILFCTAVLIALTICGVANAQSTAFYADALSDAALRLPDHDADGAVDPNAHRLPDIISYEIGPWWSENPTRRPFDGAWSSSGEFFRLDIVFNGLLNPPGTLGGAHPFDPFKYGPHPLFGYVEIDMDQDVNTGGETTSPELRYLGNAARYGGLPAASRFAGRAALDDSAFDGVLLTAPWVDRSGEEFHIAFHGWEIVDIEKELGGAPGTDPNNGVFEAGERWIIEGHLFHRAHAYERYSFACCSGDPGSYEPEVSIQFHHSESTNRTTVSLMYPLTNAGSAAMRDDDETEPLDGDASEQNSVLEALDDLVFSAQYALPPWVSDPGFAIIEGWAEKDPNDFLDPTTWDLSILVGTSYTTYEPWAPFVWTDLCESVVAGDFDGSGAADESDADAFEAYLAANDGVAGTDEDGIVNGSVDLIDFGPNFSVFDINGDGVVGPADILAGPGDFDGDGDVDIADFAVFAQCFGGALSPPAPNCPEGVDADLDNDGDVDLGDFASFAQLYTGSQ